ncbi:Histone H2A [Fasciolopsis buskii]|uniref:Histone H2A n=1 Tax=Fasciolopsis buskii TaxID=27845 RepID=A0A8E0S1H5_9TREM|nr:Histone H2A [Fasciolopsis buski]
MRTTQTVKPKGCVLSKSARSGLIFPVARILRYMKQGNAFRSKRVATKASVYLSAVIEYVTSKIILQLISAGELSELAGVHAQRDRKKIISPRHIMFAVANDDELFKCLGSVTFPFSGVVPQILAALVSSNAKSPRRSSPRPRVPTGTLSERSVGQNTKLVVLRGNILSTPGTVVVHPTARRIVFAGQVGSALQSVGGAMLADIIAKDLETNGPMEPEGVRLTEAVNMPFDYILHCDSPSYQSGNPEDSKRRLSNVIEKCLRLCDERGLPHLVLPSVGSGK